MDVMIMGCNEYKHEHCNARGIVTQSLMRTKTLRAYRADALCLQECITQN